MDKLLDASYDNMVFSNGDEVSTLSSGKVPEAFNATSTAFISSNRLNSKKDLHHVRVLERFIYNATNFDYNNILRMWPMKYRRPSTNLNTYIGNSKLVANGDTNENILGISGDGASSYFDTGVNPSSLITDINNFSIFLSVRDGSDGGGDFGCIDGGGNLFLIYIQSSGDCSMAVGTSTDSFTNSSINGIYCLNVRGGNMFLYKNGVESGSGGVSIAGSLPNFNAVLGGTNAAGSYTNFSDKTYNHLTIYNASLTEAGVQEMTNLINQFTRSK